MRKPFAHNAPTEHYHGEQRPLGYQGQGYLGIQGNHVPSNQPVRYHGNRTPGTSSVWTPNGLCLVQLIPPNIYILYSFSVFYLSSRFIGDI